MSIWQVSINSKYLLKIYVNLKILQDEELRRVERLPLHPTCVRKQLLGEAFLYFEKELLFSILPGTPGRFSRWASAILCAYFWSLGRCASSVLWQTI